MSGSSDKMKYIVLGVILVYFLVRDIFHWFADNPFTTLWIVLVIGLALYCYFNQNNTPNDSIRNEEPTDYH
ncbi:MAG: hypothetical protein JNL70_11090 [Saprospiraceae bacterium]|nr:hypothetical protein [Saprospiraceae bacterium]